MTKTYIARGLLDYQATLNVGGAMIRICFSGGSMGTNGIISARYTTDNAALQKIIENSPYFGKRIQLLSAYSDDEKGKI